MQDWESEFAPLPSSELAGIPSLPAVQTPPEAHDPDAGVLAEIDRLQRRKASWGTTLVVLVISGVLFYLIGSAAWDWKTAALLIPILLFHELGHYVSMRVFGYRNLRMFFIPLFGAAVTGRNYNVAAWKKAVVSLMGPLPGICLGVPLGVAGYLFGQKLLLEAATLMVLLNGINLIPLLPLDGGWTVHALFFSRHYLLDAGFRLVAALLMILGSVAIKEYFLTYLGAAMLFGLPLEFRRAQIVRRLRREGFAARSPDSQTIPQGVARRIVDEIRDSSPRHLGDKATAGLTLQVFESLNARPPGWLAALALAVVHFSAFVVAVFFSVLFSVAFMQQAHPRQARPAPAARPVELTMHALAAGTQRTWQGAAAGAVGVRHTLTATLADRPKAEAAFQGLTGMLPPQASAELIGQTVLVELPAEGDLEQKWLAELRSKSPDVRADTPTARVGWTFVATAPSEEAAIRIERDMRVYLVLSRRGLLSPPWSPKPLTAQESLARSTYARVEEARNRQAVDLAEEQRLVKLLGKGEEAMQEFRAGYDRMKQKSVAQAVAHVRKKEVPPLDAKVLDRYAAVAVPGPARRNPVELSPAEKELYARMGQMPLVNGKPKPADERLSLRTGFGMRKGTQLRFEWLWFKDVIDGAPAFVKWLSDQHCVELKYRVEGPGPVDNDETLVD